jgi:hypothetical protein
LRKHQSKVRSPQLKRTLKKVFCLHLSSQLSSHGWELQLGLGHYVCWGTYPAQYRHSWADLAADVGIRGPIYWWICSADDHPPWRNMEGRSRPETCLHSSAWGLSNFSSITVKWYQTCPQFRWEIVVANQFVAFPSGWSDNANNSLKFHWNSGGSDALFVSTILCYRSAPQSVCSVCRRLPFLKPFGLG